MKKILVVDDEQDLIDMITSRLQSHNYQVIGANDGVQGLERFKAERPDLVLLDIMMPNMDGFTFVQELKSFDKESPTPIIMITAKEGMDDLFREEGVTEFIRKPVEQENLLAKVKAAVGE